MARRRFLQHRERLERPFVSDFPERQRRIVLQGAVELRDRDERVIRVERLVIAKGFDDRAAEKILSAIDVSQQHLTHARVVALRRQCPHQRRAHELALLLVEGCNEIRNHYVGRTFIQPQQAIRHFSVKIKLNPVRSVLEGRRVILIDDSIVRGTTSRKIVKMVRAAGAREVHVRISCPPTISPCYYGVDTPSRMELIAATHTLEEITKYLGADSVGYLSLEGLMTAVGSQRNSYCSSCYTGVYPVPFPQDQATYLQLALKLDKGSIAEEEPVATGTEHASTR